MLFNEDDMDWELVSVKVLVVKIEVVDGVVFGVLEYDYLILVVLKSVIEWLFCVEYLFKDKLVMIVGILLGI